MKVKKEEANDYFKYIEEVDSLALDYDKCDASPFPMIVAMTDRATRIKTYGAKEFTYRKWKEKGSHLPNTIWLRNLADDITLETSSFCMDMTPEMMSELKPISDKGRTYIGISANERYALMGAINSPRSLRGSRTLVDYIVWDEFNDSLKYSKTLMISNFLNLMKSTTGLHASGEKSKRKAFILGNYTTLNHPLFIKLGISHIEGNHPEEVKVKQLIINKPEKVIRAEALVQHLFHQISFQEGFVANEQAKLRSLEREMKSYQSIIDEFNKGEN